MDTPTPDRAELRISDADRERAVEQLNQAVAEGRLTLAEFEERVQAVLAARTASEVAPHLADLPGATLPREVAPGAPVAPEHGEVRGTMSTLKRTGRWVVPRRLTVSSRFGSVKLDLTTAVISHPIIELELEVYAGSTTLVLPRGASVDVDGVNLVAGGVTIRKVTRSVTPVGRPHVIVSGRQWVGTLTVRHQHRFLWWRW